MALAKAERQAESQQAASHRGVMERGDQEPALAPFSLMGSILSFLLMGAAS